MQFAIPNKEAMKNGHGATKAYHAMLGHCGYERSFPNTACISGFQCELVVCFGNVFTPLSIFVIKISLQGRISKGKGKGTARKNDNQSA